MEHPVEQWQSRHSEKAKIRSRVWERLELAEAVHGSAVGRIPNFKQAAAASSQLASLEVWQQAQQVKCNPDKPQTPVRLAALQAGKTLYMAVPQLRQEHCFVRVTAEIVERSGMTFEEAAIAKNALKIGEPVRFEEMGRIDLLVVGCVAVDRFGGRTGKGAGFADLELGLLSHFGCVTDRTPMLTTVDELQLLDERLPMESHDRPLDWVLTPLDAIATCTEYAKSSRLDWSSIQADQFESIPILNRLRKAENSFDCSFRPALDSDLGQMLTGLNRVIDEQKYLGLAEPISDEEQRAYLKDVFEQDFPVVVAEYEGNIIGVCDVIPYPELGYRHAGKLGMWVLPEYRKKGVGRRLLTSCLDRAKKLDLEKIELQVYADNLDAIRLYESVGFVREGVRKRVRKLNSVYQDLVIMGLFLS